MLTSPGVCASDPLKVANKHGRLSPRGSSLSALFTSHSSLLYARLYLPSHNIQALPGMYRATLTVTCLALTTKEVNAVSASTTERPPVLLPGIILTRPSMTLHYVKRNATADTSSDSVSSTEVQFGDSDTSQRLSGTPSVKSKKDEGERKVRHSADCDAARRTSGPLRLQLQMTSTNDRNDRRTSKVPFPPPITPTRSRYVSEQFFAGLRAAPSPPGNHSAQFATGTLSFSGTPTPHRQHFTSFRTDDTGVVEIPRFKKRELNLGIVRRHGRHGRWQVAAWMSLWVLWVGNGLLSAVSARHREGWS